MRTNFKKSMMKGLFITLLLTITNLAIAQKNYTLDSKSDFTVKGTSSLHDWEMISKTGTASAKLTADASKVTDIEVLSVEIPAESIKSGKDGMDKNAYKALKTDVNKSIKFVLKEATKVSENNWKFTGTFTIAGTSKVVSFNVKTSVASGIVLIQGSYPCKLTEFGIKPPTALMGTIKTGDAISINFNTKLK